jgi:tRNA dimethylallyltransferase
MGEEKPGLVIIAGPTAVGKTRVSVELAKRFHGSIISADSMQVYRRMDIGSAKVTKEEMQGIPHYLIDCTDPTEEWNVFRFQKEAKQAEKEIEAANRLPFLVGGTGFYIQSFLYDIDFTEENTDFALQQELLSLAEKEGNHALWEELSAIDPEAALAIPENNVKRVVRAIEYQKLTGEKISVHNKREHEKPPAFDAVFFVLTMEREKLYHRIGVRVDRMMADGLLDEVKALKEMGLTEKDVSMQGLGYKQLLLYLDGRCTLPEAVAEIKKQTRHFAKRQLTWFKRERNVTWVQVDQYPYEDDLVEAMAEKIQHHWMVY